MASKRMKSVFSKLPDSATLIEACKSVKPDTSISRDVHVQSKSRSLPAKAVSPFSVDV